MNPSKLPGITTLLLEHVQNALGAELMGVYLHGSLALGDYDPGSSDVDFAVITQDTLGPDATERLEQMHQRLLEADCAGTLLLEGAFMPRGIAQRHDANLAVPQLHGELFYIACLEPHWVLNRAILHDHGVALVGPPAHTLIDPVGILERQQAVRDFLSEWWQPMLEHTTKLQDLEYRVYAVQTMARAICTLETGELRSKPGAIRWALEHLDFAFHEPLRTQTPSLDQALALIRHAIA